MKALFGHKETICRAYYIKTSENTEQGIIIQMLTYNLHRLTNMIILMMVSTKSHYKLDLK
jgi:hypothetical protein